MIERILDVAAALARDGVAILLVEQLVEKALRHAHYCYLLETGRIGGEGTAAQVQGSDVLHRIYLGSV